MVTNSIQTKIKPMSKSQIVISIDRLTRFKPTFDKYLRVFKDIIANNLIFPNYKKKDLDCIDFVTLTNFVEEIFNLSLFELGVLEHDDFEINNKLKFYENGVFANDFEVQKLLNNKLSYKSALKLLDETDLQVKNLNWLSRIAQADVSNFLKIREQNSLHFPVTKVIIAEGITEEILLPEFAKILDYDFDKNGLHIISAGGKNQVVKMFYSLVEKLNLPIFVLLDNDAKENYEQIEPKLRKIDKVHLVQSGEFEDLLSINLILRTINNHLKNLSSVDLKDFDKDISMVKNLEEIFKEKGLSEFKKAEFANLVKENIKSKSDLSSEIFNIINELRG